MKYILNMKERQPPEPPIFKTRKKSKPAVRRRTGSGEVSLVRVLNGQSQTIDKEKLTPEDLINGDPEIEIESGGTLPELELLPRLI